MKSTDKSGESVRAVGRALDILLAFTPADRELTVAQLLKRVDLNRATLYRLLYTLEEWGFVLADGDPQRYRLGPSVAHLAHAWLAGLDLLAIAQPILEAVWSHTGETVALFVPEGERRLCVAELPSPQPLKFKRGVGYTEHIARGASGRAILAWQLSAEEAIKRYGTQAVLSEEDFEQAMTMTRERGFGVSNHELIDGAIAIAAPFFGQDGVVAGSLGVFGPAVRLPPERVEVIGRYLVEQAEVLSTRLGHRVTR